MSKRILVVDDRESIRLFIVEALRQSGHDVNSAQDGVEALSMLETQHYHLLITDLKMPRMDGMTLLKKVKQSIPELEVIILTAHGTINTAVEAMKLGAFDYLTKPLNSPDELRLIVNRALDHRRLKTAELRNAEEQSKDIMMASDPAMKKIIAMMDKVAQTDATVLLTGESGTGKEVAAGYIHRHSKRADAPFIAVNCAAISPHLVESEMFGHEKGAFTGADEQRQGRFELADGGTLFLDEVGELPLELQAKLLRVLQERTFERLGGTRPIEVDVRVVAATNRDLQFEISQAQFREDLYHRLSVFPIHLPPLRDRTGDILPIADYLLKQITSRLGRPQLSISESVQKQLISNNWPGNIRELGNTLERAAILCDDTQIETEHILLQTSGQDQEENDSVSLKDIERNAIKKALLQTDGHRKNAAKLLGIGLRTLYNKIKEYDLE